MSLPRCFGRYVLLERIAGGGMGEVFVAVPRSLWGYEKFFAVKKILPALSSDPHFLSRFKDEARLVIPMNHPNVVQVLEVGRVEEDYFIAMEYVEGRSLGQLLSRSWKARDRWQVSLAASLFLIRELAAALEYCHRRTDATGAGLGVVHRDVSPSNVLISYDGAVKLADFGLALSALKAVNTEPNLVFGHLGYIAPEALDGRRQDPRADIFSAGVLLFELLTCQRFAPGVDPLAVQQQMRLRARVKASSYRSELPPDVDEIVSRATAPDPEGRFQSARALQDALQRALARLDPLFASRELSERVMHVLFDPERKRHELRALVSGLDIEELEARSPAGRTFCIGEAIPLAPAPGRRRPFGTDAAVLTLLDELFEGDTEPLSTDEGDLAAAEDPAAHAEPFAVSSSSRSLRSRERRRRWLTPPPSVNGKRVGALVPLLRGARTKP